MVLLKSRLGELRHAIHELAAHVAVEVSIRVEVERLLGELREEAELLNGASELDAGEAHPVDPATSLGQRRKSARDRADILGRPIEVAVGIGRAGSIQTLVVDVAVIQQRNVVIDLNLLTIVLRSKSTLNHNGDRIRKACN